MMLSISTSCAVILTQIILLNIRGIESTANNTTDYPLSWKAGRLKRSLFLLLPRSLRMTIKLETGENIYPHWKKQKSSLANDNLPIFTNGMLLNTNVMKEVGEYVLYHDAVRCSAVVYFKKFHALYGVIGMNYYVHGIPFNFDDRGEYRGGVVGVPHVIKNGYDFSHIHPDMVLPPPFDTAAWEEFVRTTNFIPRNEVAPSTSHQPMDDGRNANSVSEQSFHDTHYLEILVFVTRDLVERFKIHFGSNYIVAIVRYYIIYFNTVDMMFRQLADNSVQVVMNIAKIVIEDDLTPFTFMSDGEIEFADVVSKLPLYFRSNRAFYLPESFDYVFIHTSRSIKNMGVPINGMSKYQQNMYGARQNDIFYPAVPTTMVEFKHFYADYVVAVHEIGLTLGMLITPKEYGLESFGQCADPMQREGSKCNRCLVWSNINREQFRTYLRQNRDRCFLLNPPRSLRPPGIYPFVSLNRQCICFGFKSSVTNPQGIVTRSVGLDGCTTPLICQGFNEMRSFYQPTVRPLDGTKCGKLKVCWDGECKKTSPS